MKSVLISIQPKWCELIANGKKTVEVRKTRPKLDVPFKCYIYCTNTRPYLVWGDVFRGNWETEFTHLSGYNRKEAEKIWDVFNGKVIGEFVCDRIDEIGYSPEMHGKYISDINDLHKVTCIDFEQMFDYIADGYGYGWHISDLEIYDTPKELSEFCVLDNEAVQKCEHRLQTYYAFTDTGYIKNGMACTYKDDWCTKCKTKPITRPPQSWCYVEELK